MINRKKGETNKQFISRLESHIQNVEENNRALRSLNQSDNLLNTRTGNSYQYEADQMFTSIALIEKFLREDSPEYAQQIAQGILRQLGFDEVEIYSNQCIKDDIYNGKKS